MRSVWLNSWSASKQAVLFATASLALLAGCSSSSSPVLIGVTPAATQTLDAGQTLSLQAALINDVTHQGVTWALTGPGALTGSSLTPQGESTIANNGYAAPAVVTAQATATITAKSIAFPSAVGTFNIILNSAFTLSATTATLPACTTGIAYTSPTLTATGGSGTPAYTITSGALPAGLTLKSSNGTLSGTPSVAGTFSFTVSAADSATAPTVLSQPYTLAIAPVLTTTSVPNAIAGVPYSQQLAFAGGAATAGTFAITAGALPASSGLTLSPSGLIAGTPTAGAAGTTYSFSVAVTVGSQPSAPRAYTITLTSPITFTTPPTLPQGTIGTAYAQSISATGGTNTGFTYALATGSALPAGLTLSPTGLLTGSPTATGNFTFTLQATDSAGAKGTQTFTLTVPATPVVVTPATFGPSETFVAFSQQLAYTGGPGGTPTFALVSGTLPAGVTVSPAGLVSGTPKLAGSFTFTVTVTVGTSTSAPQSFTLTVSSLAITSGTAASGEIALPFSFPNQEIGGVAPFTWTITAGSNPLPAGLTLSASTGQITGTPTTAGTTQTSITVTDSASNTIAQPLTITTAAARNATANAQLNGQYAFLLTGFDAARNPITYIGKFTADGAGNIASGLLDINGTDVATPSSQALLPTTYSVSTGNRGKLTLSTTAATTNFVLSLNQAGTSGFLTEFDSSGQSLTGTFALQDPTAFVPTQIVGGFTFGASGFSASSNSHQGIIGTVQLSGSGSVSSGEVLSSATGTTPLTVSSGTYTVTPTGRGTLQLAIPGSGNNFSFILYVVNARQFYLTSANSGTGTNASSILFSGQLLAQTITTGFSNAALNGTAVGRMSRLLPTTNGSTTTYSPDVRLGLYTFNGTGKATFAGDENNGGTTSTVAAAGTYFVATNGRVTQFVSTGIGGCLDCTAAASYLYLVGQNQGFSLDYLTGIDTGTLEPQTANPIFAGTYAAGTVTPLAAPTRQSTSTLTTGNATLTESQDLAQNTNPYPILTPDRALTGTFTQTTNGRVAITLSDGTQPVLYLVSPTRALRLDLSTTTPILSELNQ